MTMCIVRSVLISMYYIVWYIFFNLYYTMADVQKKSVVHVCIPVCSCRIHTRSMPFQGIGNNTE